MRTRIPVLNILIDNVTMNEAVGIIENFIKKKTPHLIATANAEMVMMAQADEELSQILNQADLVVPDGAGVVWAARYQGYIMPERVAGYDLTQRLLAKAADKGYRIYIFGSAPGIAEKAKEAAAKSFPGLQIVGIRNGFFTNQDEYNIVDDIKACCPDILLVALGVPKQEKWLSAHLKQLNIPVAIGIGGTLDVMAGMVQRAPLWMQQANLEWLFRLLSQPRRAIRMLALPRFIIRILFGKKY